MTPAAKQKAVGAIVALVVLAGISGRASPGFAVGRVTGAVTRTVRHALTGGAKSAPVIKVPAGRAIGASQYALADIPAAYLALYVKAAPTCPKLNWQLLAGIGKVETNHGRSTLPGVHTGINQAHCCAGPMQFNLTNGPPSTWQAYGRGGNPYDPADAIPAAARKLCANGLYNNACWYVHEVLTFAARYTTAPASAASSDPFVQALVHNPRITTTTARGCDPAPDLASGNLDLRVQSILAVLAQHWRVRVSCIKSGHSYYVAGTTRVSNHTVWRAVDLDQVNGHPISPQSSEARALVVFLDRLQGPLRPIEVGSPWALGHRPYFTDEGHQEHVHIGYGAL